MKCDARRASGFYADDNAEFGCEMGTANSSCDLKFLRQVFRLKGCPGCTKNNNDVPKLIFQIWSHANSGPINGLVYCDTSSGTPFGGDDTGGFIPAPASAKCEAGAAKATGKLVACIDKCHALRASGILADETAEEACENGSGTSCTASFSAAIAKLKGCPACINGTTMASLAAAGESLIDGNNGAVYCASPSGAFVQ
jgi:hypothetical protein